MKLLLLNNRQGCCRRALQKINLVTWSQGVATFTVLCSHAV